MCLGIPGKIVEILDDANHIARVDVAGVRRSVNIALVRPDGADVGDWVLIHVGFALSLLDEAAAAETLRFLEMLGTQYSEEMAPPDSSELE